MTKSLSIPQARKLVLMSQRLPPKGRTGTAAAATLSAIEHLGYIQIDTIAVIQRAHHHTLWNRNPRYSGSQLDKLVGEKAVFEYWAHAAAYLPMRDYRYSLPRKQAMASGRLDHWYDRDQRLMKSVLERIRIDGPLMARDFEHTGKPTGEWQSKPAKRALENLFMQGELMAPRRVNFHKVYDLTERVLPAGINATLPSTQEYGRFLVTRYLKANGLAQVAEIAYLLKGTKELVTSALKEMLHSGEVVQIGVGGSTYYTLPTSLELLERPLARGKLKILSPFDNLVIQRKRIQDLFGFDYLLECYVPEPDRTYGYFALPILWDGKLVARMDCKADRKRSLLHIRNLALEPGIIKLEAFCHALGKELKSFLAFNNCRHLQLHRASPAPVKTLLEGELDDEILYAP